MDIQQAKEQIKRAVRIYLMKDAFGNYRIPIQEQRPVFLVGAPGIGKTAIMAQIAKELDICLVPYSMTHHTRQSALGLPMIVKKEFGGRESAISEYTMSEIIASVYEAMETSGKKEGILFLDEINCVSETLAPSMLQFLQYKTFGNHRVPDGWVIVTAGNPPEYNRSVREFDIVTLDRLKVIVTEPNYGAWRTWALDAQVHRAIVSYLDIHRDNFYRIENTGKGRTYVTARGWEDLSQAVKLYEEAGFPVDEDLISQYIRNEHICADFGSYYRLYHKYGEDYHVQDILAGNAPEDVCHRAEEAGFDEKMTLIGLLLDALRPSLHAQVVEEDALRALHGPLASCGELVPEASSSDVLCERLESLAADEQGKETADEAGKTATAGARFEREYKKRFLKALADEIRKEEIKDAAPAWELIRQEYAKRVRSAGQAADTVKRSLDNIFDFAAEAFGKSDQMLVLVTDLSASPDAARFISRHGCAGYYEYSRQFMLYERSRTLRDEIRKFTDGTKTEDEGMQL
ncbi:MAG: AAA family ATPase [Lachnospira sp.]|nr:AAA family ATPase [Lachnospira sp.]